MDRRNEEVLELLCRLVHAKSKASPGEGSKGKWPLSSLEKEWLEHLKKGGYDPPDRTQPYLPEYKTRPDFAYVSRQAVVYIDGPHHQQPGRRMVDKEITRHLQDAGFTVARFSTDRAGWNKTIDDYAWVFGSGHQTEEV